MRIIPGTNFYELQQQPEKDSAVLGGLALLPEPGSLVLGTGRRFALLFDRFNSESKMINGSHQQLRLSSRVNLVRRRKALPLDDLKILVTPTPNLGDKGWWQFAGYLKHDGSLFSHTAKYDPARCERALRKIALEVLRQ